MEGNFLPKGDPISSVTTSTSSSMSNTVTTSASGSAKDIVANGVASKSELTNHMPVSSTSNNVGSACISRVVTTTITTTSGGKTVTKPLTILYASPSKLQSQMNGPATSNYGKMSINASAVNTVSSLPARTSIKQESKHDKPATSIGQQKVNGIAKLVNDSLYLNNMKVKGESIKSVSVPTINTTTAGVNTRTAAVTTVSSSSTVPTSTVSASKVTPTTPTKLIVLTSASSGNIIKTIATGGTNQISGGTLLTLSTPGGINSGTAKVLSGVANSATMTTSAASSSPGRVGPAASTSAATANAINSICAAAGVDAFNGQFCCLLLFLLKLISCCENKKYRMKASMLCLSPDCSWF